MSAADVLTIQRPEGVTDARWQTLQRLAQHTVSGHHPWCEDHYEDTHGGWCNRTESRGGIEAQLTTGTLTGLPMIGVWPKRGDGVDLTELSLSQAVSLVDLLERMICEAGGSLGAAPLGLGEVDQ